MYKAMIGIRITLGLGLVLLFTLHAAVRTALMVEALNTSGLKRNQDLATIAEKRFRGIKEALPPRGVIGYRACGPLTIDEDQELEGDGQAMIQYIVAQYALAPRVLDISGAREIVIHDDLDGVRLSRGPDR